MADLMGSSFDPTGPVVVRFRNGAQELDLPAGLELEGAIWRAPGVKGVRFNSRGVAIINEHGEIQRPWFAMAVNPPGFASRPARPA